MVFGITSVKFKPSFLLSRLKWKLGFFDRRLKVGHATVFQHKRAIFYSAIYHC